MAKEAMKVIGKSVPVMEARDKVTGRSQFVDDMKAELFIKILGSPHAHARIKSIDVSRAEKLAGVEAILTYKEVPHRLIPFRAHRSCYAMDEHLRYLGDYVAAVAATSEAIAEEALELIDVDYEVLPAVFDPEEAAKPTAPKIYPEGNVFGTSSEVPLERGTHEPSLQEWGDIAKGFEEADAVVEDNFDVTSQIHAPIEPHVCMARWKGDELTIWNATQTPWELRYVIAYLFEISESKVVVLSPNVGGGFGGKYTGRYQAVTCLLSRMAGGKATKLTLTREEDQCYCRRPRGKLYAKIGARKDGTITALQLRGYFDIGAYGNFKGGSTGFYQEGGILSYKVDNARFEAWDVHTNHFRGECMRSVHVPFMAFPVELIVDEVAEKLGLDPVEIRLKNMPETGDMMPPTPYTHNCGGWPRERLDIYPGKKMLQQVMERIDWKRKWRGFGQPAAINGSKRRGIGLVYCEEYSGYHNDGSTSIQVVINRDGSAIVHSGAQEIGQGINTTLRMLAAESLGISLEDVAIVTADTRTGQYDLVNARGSHQLATDGHLLLGAIEEAKQKIRDMVAPVFQAEPEAIEIKGKKAYLKGHPEGAKPLRDLLSVTVTGSAAGPPGSVCPAVKPGFKARQPVVMTVEVEVDIETGVVKPIKLVTGMFPGRMINQGVVRGQAIGGVVQTLGWALWEEFKYDKEAATYLSKDFTDYKIPRALDIPEIETVLVEEVDETSPPHEGLPYGGRGIGEMSCWGGPVVIASAIYNATGVRIKKSPMTAETVLEALGKEAGK
jgi:CO/xanthine dehydrogenase Mo-binding subunit